MEERVEYLQKLKKIASYWIKHNREHVEEHQKWRDDAKRLGLEQIADRLGSVVGLLKEADSQFDSINQEIDNSLKQDKN